jgi:hypothetical protein
MVVLYRKICEVVFCIRLLLQNFLFQFFNQTGCIPAFRFGFQCLLRPQYMQVTMVLPVVRTYIGSVIFNMLSEAAFFKRLISSLAQFACIMQESGP